MIPIKLKQRSIFLKVLSNLATVKVNTHIWTGRTFNRNDLFVKQYDCFFTSDESSTDVFFCQNGHIFLHVLKLFNINVGWSHLYWRRLFYWKLLSCSGRNWEKIVKILKVVSVVRIVTNFPVSWHKSYVKAMILCVLINE